MSLLHATVAILGFLSVGHSAPVTNCESLTQRINIESRDQLLGKWIYSGESINIPGTKMLTKQYIDSAFVNITAAPNNDSVTIYQSQRGFGSCLSFSSTQLVANNAMHMTKPYKSTEVLLTTGCSDCLVVMSNFTLGSTYYQGLQLLSKRQLLTTAELDEFKKQAECLNLPAPVIMDPLKELCPEGVGQETENTDVTSLINSDMFIETVKVLDSVINTKDGLMGFFNKMLTAKGD